MDKLQLLGQLDLPRCPHCRVDTPNLKQVAEFHSSSFDGIGKYWKCYTCNRCGGVTTACAENKNGSVIAHFPQTESADLTLPEKAWGYLQQAMDTLHAPAGSIMLSASAIDAMLKERGFKKDSLHSRINEAAKVHLITDGMKKWAHQVKLDANDQRHADESASLPTHSDAERTLEFARGLAQFLFVLPAMVEEGTSNTKEKAESAVS